MARLSDHLAFALRQHLQNAQADPQRVQEVLRILQILSDASHLSSSAPVLRATRPWWRMALASMQDHPFADGVQEGVSEKTASVRTHRGIVRDVTEQVMRTMGEAVAPDQEDSFVETAVEDNAAGPEGSSQVGGTVARRLRSLVRGWVRQALRRDPRKIGSSAAPSGEGVRSMPFVARAGRITPRGRRARIAAQGPVQGPVQGREQGAEMMPGATNGAEARGGYGQGDVEANQSAVFLSVDAVKSGGIPHLQRVPVSARGNATWLSPGHENNHIGGMMDAVARDPAHGGSFSAQVRQDLAAPSAFVGSILLPTPLSSSQAEGSGWARLEAQWQAVRAVRDRPARRDTGQDNRVGAASQSGEVFVPAPASSPVWAEDFSTPGFLARQANLGLF